MTSPRLCANINMLFGEYPLAERFMRAAHAGFEAVEILNPYELPAEQLAEAARAAAIPVVLINAPLGNIRGGERGFAADPGAVELFRQAMQQAFRYAAALSAERINVLPGKALQGDDPDTLRGQYADNLRWAADIAGAHGVKIDVEALNREDIAGSLLPTQADVFALLEELDHPAIDLQFDYYHCLKEKQDPVEQYLQVSSRVGHIQFADPAGRQQPKADDVALQRFVEVVLSQGYRGWFSAEYRPAGHSLESLSWMRQFKQTEAKF